MIPETDRLLTPAEVAALFGVNPRTVWKWTTPGMAWLTPVKTPGGHNRFRESEVLALRNGPEYERADTGSL